MNSPLKKRKSNRGGKIKKKLLFAVLLVAALSMICISGVSAASTYDYQTQFGTDYMQEEIVVTDESDIDELDKEELNEEEFRIIYELADETTDSNTTSAEKTLRSASVGQKSAAPSGEYLKATKNCQVNDPKIKALAASITKGKKTAYEKAVAIFNWVRDKTVYKPYYNTRQGAISTLKTRMGNCADLSHLVVALERAAGIPARYVYGNCFFYKKGKKIGHVWAQVLVNGKWYSADASHNANSFGVIKNWNTKTAVTSGGKYGTYSTLPF